METTTDIYVNSSAAVIHKVRAGSRIQILASPLDFCGEPGWADVRVQETSGKIWRGYAHLETLTAGTA
jgi:hypothetical protein